MAKSMDEIAGILQNLKFKTKLVGGVDEAEVWKALEMLQKEYRDLMESVLLRGDALLAERNRALKKLQQENATLKAHLAQQGGSYGTGNNG